MGAGARSPGTQPLSAVRTWWGNHLGELRWQAELARLLVDPVYHGFGVPHGSGGPVLLVPGFLAGDSSLTVMADWLTRIGYRPRPSGIQLNVDCSNRALLRLERRAEEAAEEAGERIAVVGHSRGGHFAKALAHRRPELVRAVVSLGTGLDTPFDISLPTLAAVALARAVQPQSRPPGCFTTGCGCPFAHHFRSEFPPEIPLTSVYTRGDGVVWWEACVVPYARCVEVTGSHLGLACNRKAYQVLAEALASAFRPA
jgi:pimeloyl-ACP methyl ester carboxylesterase